jgi:hypothetical protein
MAAIDTFLAPDALAGLTPEVRERLDAAWAQVSAEPGDCVLAHTEVVVGDISTRVVVWHPNDGEWVGQHVTIEYAGTTYRQTLYETRDAQGRVLTRREIEDDGRQMRTEAWKYGPGMLRHMVEEPYVESRTLHVERWSDRKLTIAHAYREGPFRKRSKLEVAFDDAGHPVTIESVMFERDYKIPCVQRYVWTGNDATYELVCDGVVEGRGTESRDAEGRPTARTFVTGEGDNAWSSSWDWTWGPQGLERAHRIVPFAGEVTEAFVRDENGRVVAELYRGSDAAIDDFRGLACPAEEPKVPRWSGDEF